MHILVTGGAGYIGSHTCVAAYAAGHTITILDNLSNSSPESLNRIEKISGKRPRLVVGDIGDRSVVRAVLDSEKFDAVIHFAGYKAVGESVAKPWEYYQNNVAGTLVLLDELRRHGVRNFIFSSSATVYGNPDPKNLPLKETAPLSALNPYGATKLWLEEIMRAMSAADPAWHFLLLRYFNPVGAHESGLMGEDPAGIPNNLMPYITQVAVGRLTDARRHRHPRLHPRVRPGGGARRRAREGRGPPRLHRDQPRLRLGRLRRAARRLVREGDRPPAPAPVRPAPPRRRRGLLRGRLEGAAAPRLEDEAQLRRHVPRRLELAEQEPERLPRRLRRPRDA